MWVLYLQFNSALIVSYKVKIDQGSKFKFSHFLILKTLI